MADEQLDLIVLEPDQSSGASERASAIEVRGKTWDAIVARVKPSQTHVDLTKVKGDLDRVQGQIDSLLAGLRAKDSDRFRLAQVEVSLAVSAEGSIGVATAGVQAGIALTFSRIA
jgi:hypothetical protein